MSAADSSSPSALAWLLLPAFVLIGYFGPGYLLSRRIQSPAVILASFIGSVVVLFHGVILLDALRIPLTYLTVTGLLAIVCVGVFFTNRKLSSTPLEPRPSLHLKWADAWWLIPVGCALISVFVRSAMQPLSGYDNLFRWDFLARQLLHHGHLRFYPPITAEDFDVYGWCDGIPPLVSILNFWLYLGSGSSATLITSVRIAIEITLLFYAVFLLGRNLWGPGGGKGAVAVLATSALLLWGVAIGQETGLTALGMVAMLYFITEYQKDGRTASIIWAASAAGVAALSREYALAFPAIGIFALAWRRPPMRAVWLFAIVATAIAAPWYLRNFAHTGNPLYSQNIFGLFPVNEAYIETNRTIAAFISPRIFHGFWMSVVMFLGVLIGVAVILGFIGLFKSGRRGLPYAAAFTMVGGLWIWSLGQTAGGPLYSMRVLTPAIAIAAALSGWVGLIAKPRWHITISLILCLFSIDAARRSWLMPAFPDDPPLPYSWQQWRAIRQELHLVTSHRVWDALASTLGAERVVVDHPAYFAELTKRNAHPVPLFSPRVASFYRTDQSWEVALAALRENDIRLVVLTVGSPMSEAFLNRFPFLKQLHSRQPNVMVDSLAIYDLAFLNAAAP